MLDFINEVTHWLTEHAWIAGMLTALSLLTILATIFLVPWAIVRIPTDYFAHRRPTRTLWEQLHPGVRITALALKNLLGVLLLLAGLLLSVPMVPGPGVVTMLVGLALLDVPGKRSLERWIASRPPIFAAMNRLRAKHGHPPLEHPGA